MFGLLYITFRSKISITNGFSPSSYISGKTIIKLVVRRILKADRRRKRAYDFLHWCPIRRN